MSILKPCPFCGGIMVSYSLMPYIGYDGHGYVVECDRCWAKTGYYRTKEEAFEAWNTRHVETCRREKRGMDMTRWKMCCSNCGYGLGDMRWEYCPNCGGKVVG